MGSRTCAESETMPVTTPSESGAQRKGWPEPTDDPPTDDDLELMVYDSIVEATDGCSVEPDGTCEHGHPSWLLRMGLI